MEEYKIMFQIIAFVFIFILVYYLYRYIIYIFRAHRLKSYTIKNTKKNYVYSNIDKITKKFVNLNFYQKRKNRYDKYLTNNTLYNSSHILTLKLFTGFLLILVYLFECMLYKLNLNLFIAIILYLVGYYIIDIILYFEYSNKVLKMDNNLTKVMIIMNNGYRVNKNHREVVDAIIEEVREPLKSEFKIVRNDLSKGLDISNSLFRMYERTGIEKVLYMSELLGLNVKYGISIIDICDALEKIICKKEKREFYLLRLKNTNKLVISLLAIIPLFVVGLLIIMNYDFFLMLELNKIIIITLGELFIYIFYMFVILSVFRREL